MKKRDKMNSTSVINSSQLLSKESQVSVNDLYEKRTQSSKPISKKILLIGYNKVGKSSIATKFLFDFFPESKLIDPFLENYSKIINYKKMKIELIIIDTPPLDEESFMVPQQYSSGVSGYILIYSINSMKSFEIISKIRDKLFNLNGYHLPCLLIGNKNDDANREVSFQNGNILAHNWKIPFFEISAREDSVLTIERIFKQVVIEIFKGNTDEDLNVQCLQSIKKMSNTHQVCMITTLKVILVVSLMAGLFYFVLAILNSIYECSHEINIFFSVFLFIIGIIIIVQGITCFYGLILRKMKKMKIAFILGIIGALFEIGVIISLSVYDADNSDTVKKNEPYLTIYGIFFCISLFLEMIKIFNISAIMYIIRKEKNNSNYDSINL